MADFYWENAKMSEEKRNELKEALNTALLCGITFIVVGHLHSYFGGNTAKATPEKTAVTKNIIKNDSIKTDSIPTLSFIQENIKQQKTR